MSGSRMPRCICFRLKRRRQSLDSIVIPTSDHFFRAILLKALIHFISCNSLALGYLAAAVPHWQIPFVMPSLSPQPETHWFFFSLLQPYPIHPALLDMKRFNFCRTSTRTANDVFFFLLIFQTVPRSPNRFIYFCFCLYASSTFVWFRQNMKNTVYLHSYRFLALCVMKWVQT